jgi:CRISPR/Cas system CSM-associated protein Csm3 (group 7 of RAMP superfamily)
LTVLSYKLGNNLALSGSSLKGAIRAHFLAVYGDPMLTADLFGFSHGESAESRVFFSDAISRDTRPKYVSIGREWKPHKSCEKGGIKFYIPEYRKDINIQDLLKKGYTCLETIPAGTKLEGRLIMTNSTIEELTKVLAVMSPHQEGTRENCGFRIGRAKPFGIGRVKLLDFKVEEKPNPTSGWREIDVKDRVIREFSQRVINTETKGCRIPNNKFRIYCK